MTHKEVPSDYDQAYIILLVENTFGKYEKK
jgi:hypothetical protein